MCAASSRLCFKTRRLFCPALFLCVLCHLLRAIISVACRAEAENKHAAVQIRTSGVVAKEGNYYYMMVNSIFFQKSNIFQLDEAKSPI